MKTAATIKLEKLLCQSMDSRNDFFVFECTIGWLGKEIVDCIKYTVQREIYCYEIKQSKQDFYSKNALTFIGNYNYFVMPYALYEQVKADIPKGIGVYVSISEIETVVKETKYGTEYSPKYTSGFNQLICIQKAKRQELKADKEVILSSMLRSMQRDRLWNYKELQNERTRKAD